MPLSHTLISEGRQRLILFMWEKKNQANLNNEYEKSELVITFGGKMGTGEISGRLVVFCFFFFFRRWLQSNI